MYNRKAAGELKYFRFLTVLGKRLIIILFNIAFNVSLSQPILTSQEVQKRFNEITLDADTSVFTGFRSTDWLEYKTFLNKQKQQLTDSAFGLSPSKPRGYFLKHLTTNSWVQANGKNSLFTIDPYIDASFGKSKEVSNILYQASAGVSMRGVINDKVSYGLYYVYTSTRFVSYLNNYAGSNQAYALGMGKGKLLSNGSYGFSQVTGYFTYIPNKHFLIGVGNGKNFIGDGYRSLILSDNASNYPYVRLQARYWKLTYNVVYAELDNPRYPVDGADQRKYSAMHYLGINISKRLQLGLYDNVIWYTKDTNIHRGFDVQYLNPLIFMRPLEFAVGSPDNAFIGITAKYRVYKTGFLYGQIGIDDLNITKSFKNHAQDYGNKYALQLGIWNKNIFNISNLSWRFEWNGVRPYTYTHGFDKPGLNYTNDNQALADPFGANFHEFISIFHYNNKRWYGMLENLFTIRGEQPAGQDYPIGYDLWAGDITNTNGPAYGSTTLQGVKNKYLHNQVTAGYLINPRNRLAIEWSGIYRRHTAPGVYDSELYFTIGIKTRIANVYSDF